MTAPTATARPRRRNAADEIETYVSKVVAKAPRLSTMKREELAGLLCSSALAGGAR